MPVTVKSLKIDVRTAGKQVARKRVRDCTQAILAKADELTPTRTGNLKAHNKFRILETSRDVRGEVYNDADYAKWVHGKTRPHIIRPRRKKALKFIVNGTTVFARKVQHPGTKGQPWLLQAQRAVAARYGFKITKG